MTVLLAILGFGKSFFGAAFSWLSKRSLAEIGCIILGLVALVAILNGQAEKRHSAKLQAQVVKLNAELQRITTSKNEQRAVTKERIKTVTRLIHDAEGKAKMVEAAPLPGNCKSPREVLDADI